MQAHRVPASTPRPPSPSTESSPGRAVCQPQPSRWRWRVACPASCAATQLPWQLASLLTDCDALFARAGEVVCCLQRAHRAAVHPELAGRCGAAPLPHPPAPIPSHFRDSPHIARGDARSPPKAWPS
eukprot:5591641-Prymnesium_polylepis.2